MPTREQPSLALELAALDQHVGRVRVKRALDVACGTRGMSGELFAFAENVHALDIDRAALHVTRRRTEAVCIQGEAGVLPFAEGAFDLVSLFDILNEADDDVQVLRAAWRVVRPGGLIAIRVPTRTTLSRTGRTYTRRTLTLACVRSRLRVERCTHTGLLTWPFTAPLAGCFAALRKLGFRVPHWRVPSALRTLARPLLWLEELLAERFNLSLGTSLLILARRPLGTRTPDIYVSEPAKKKQQARR
jgi:SAM-dependent methyltransferase